MAVGRSTVRLFCSHPDSRCKGRSRQASCFAWSEVASCKNRGDLLDNGFRWVFVRLHADLLYVGLSFWVDWAGYIAEAPHTSHSNPFFGRHGQKVISSRRCGLVVNRLWNRHLWNRHQGFEARTVVCWPVDVRILPFSLSISLRGKTIFPALQIGEYCSRGVRTDLSQTGLPPKLLGCDDV